VIHKLINYVWNKEELPDQWKEYIIVPIHKKGWRTTPCYLSLTAYSVYSYNTLIEFGVSMKLVRLIKMCLNERYSKIHINKYLSDSFPIQYGPKEGESLLPLLLNFAVEYDSRKVQENQVVLKLNETHNF
jgi:hypothetical protein